ncbi:hypothetical protein J6590_107821 [Homalodisca vitripennis]|nr:hypothetical protein J6590_107821 [Homalodisca vitripennis]
MVYTLGSIWPWRVVAALSSALPAAGLILMATLPESPVWLVNSGRVDKARKSLLWLRGGDQCKKSSPEANLDQQVVTRYRTTFAA